ncbi:DUF1127 domain-containing protein [Vibrio hippocampi]|uniref:DUF1127 domain-containing protein n=1 Tax=Vibrio hippocampi TaxID=654686 RepID=A0ABM8ZJ03_9VIBR|nr:DUF1127 domain-containing protein [Vibrio hippocampi]CAH0526801.1 hypothetical protein VHP8226_02177 [Vibrio hippocampi]
MRTSIYLTLATCLIKADIHTQEREWKRRVRRNRYYLPLHSEHLMKDIGFDKTGRPLGDSKAPDIIAERKVRLLRRVLYARLTT